MADEGLRIALVLVGFTLVAEEEVREEGERERKSNKLGKTTKNGEGAPRPTFIQRVKTWSSGSWLCPSVPRRITPAPSGRTAARE